MPGKPVTSSKTDRLHIPSIRVVSNQEILLGCRFEIPFSRHDFSVFLICQTRVDEHMIAGHLTSLSVIPEISHWKKNRKNGIRPDSASLPTGAPSREK